MERDKLKEEQNSNLADTVIDVTGKAAAVATGAALLYRSIGGRNISRAIERASLSRRAIRDEINRTEYRDYSIDKLREMHGNIIQRFNSIKTKMDNSFESIDIRTDRANSLLEKMNNAYQYIKNPNRLSKTIYNDTYLLNPTLNKVDDLMDRIGATKRERSEAVKFVRKLPFIIGGKNEANEIEQLRRNIVITKENKAFDEALTLASNYMSNIYHSEKKNYYSVKPEIDKIGKNILDKLLDVDELSRIHNKKTPIDLALDDQRAKVKDYIKDDNKDLFSRGSKIGSYIDDKGKPISYDRIEAFKEIGEYIRTNRGEEDFNKFLDIDIDAFFRKDKSGNLYSFSELSNVLEDAVNTAAGTLPGKILKIRDIQYSRMSSSLVYIGSGSVDPLLSGAVNKELDKTTGTFFRIYDKTYQVDKDSALTHLAEFD